MKERPILFKAEMVQAILSGRKTQTRRIVKPTTKEKIDILSAIGECYPLENPKSKGCTFIADLCPIGIVGDRLWVREAFGQVYDTCEHSEMSGCPTEFWHLEWKYRADNENPVIEEGSFTGWKPSIHMPRSASRILLEITGVRVERLNDISEEDACDEGTPNPYGGWVGGFKQLWESINGDGSWEANPWVWVIEFKVVERAA